LDVLNLDFSDMEELHLKEDLKEYKRIMQYVHGEFVNMISVNITLKKLLSQQNAVHQKWCMLETGHISGLVYHSGNNTILIGRLNELTMGRCRTWF
jgi:hypothetical protein